MAIIKTVVTLDEEIPQFYKKGFNFQAKDIFMTNEDQVLQDVNKGAAIKRYAVSSQLQHPDFRSNQLQTQYTKNYDLYNDSDRQNLSKSVATVDLKIKV